MSYFPMMIPALNSMPRNMNRLFRMMMPRLSPTLMLGRMLMPISPGPMMMMFMGRGIFRRRGRGRIRVSRICWRYLRLRGNICRIRAYVCWASCIRGRCRILPIKGLVFELPPELRFFI